jgi:hypothetical protein
MDEGFTQHSACPVFEGEKKVVVQWVRYGVDDVNTSDSFNSRKLLDAAMRSFFLFFSDI